VVRHPGSQAAQSGRTKKWIETAEGWARANLLLDKSSYLPPVGSLKEALFLTVWLRRSEAEALKTRLLAQGIIDIAQHGSKSAETIYKAYVHTLLPFLAKDVVSKDEELKKVMEREVKKGVIAFNVSTPNPLMQRAKTMAVPDDFRQKLAQRKKRDS
jgi:post-segregation antitoxin (ccd killing protein)